MNSERRPKTTLSTGSRVACSVGLVSALAAALLTGCATSPAPPDIAVSAEALQSYVRDKPAQLRPMYEKVLREGERNLVLNHLQVGLAAMDLGALELAEESFDQALLHIETVYANNEAAAKARSLWYEEGMKDYKGEPYERAMAYYYRGLLYLQRGDCENARASFKSGVLQDAFAEEEQNRSDFALLILLEGWASQCLKDEALARAAYEEVQQLRPDFVPPAWDHNTLIIAETGTAPRKVADGIGHAELKYFRGKGFTEQRVRVRVGTSTYEAYPMEDIAWQAMTRGGRPIDKILQGKVIFRQRNEQVATALTDVASNAVIAAPLFQNVQAVSTGLQGLGGALGLIGVTQMALAANARPQADTRYWNNLPNAVHVFTGKFPLQEQTVVASFYDASGAEIPNLRSQATLARVHGTLGFAWLRSQSTHAEVR